MTESELNALAADWVLYHLSPDASVAQENLFWVCEKEWAIINDSPEDGWRLIGAVMRMDASATIVEVLAAGPLEDLLAKHGNDFIDRVEMEARQNPQFANLLGGVWRNSMSSDVWARVQAVWDRSGWDGR